MGIRYKTWADLDILTADDVNAYLGNQVVVWINQESDRASVAADVNVIYQENIGKILVRTTTNTWEVVEVEGHASKHASGGSDPITPAAIGALATSALPSSWTAFTPTFNTSNSNFSIGNGSVSGSKITFGGLTIVQGRINFNTSTTLGTGNARLTLPSAVSTYLRPTVILKSGGSSQFFASMKVYSGNTWEFIYGNTAVTTTYPFNWTATPDQGIEYEMIGVTVS